MKKRIILKTWVQYLLITILALAFIVGTIDFESTRTFVIVHFIDALVMLITFYLLYKYTHIFE